ncbi:hypothetical protein ABZV52_30085 [Streptomyces sp. NPDC004735]|uniref:hypothetical protein n=1 Tax=Streptomyces TaxID=1883 RepID=UPI0033A3397F
MTTVTLDKTAAYIVIADTDGENPRLTPGNTVAIVAVIHGSANAERYARQLAHVQRQCIESPNLSFIELDAANEATARCQAREYFNEDV